MTDLSQVLFLAAGLLLGGLVVGCGLLLVVVGWSTLRQSLGQSRWDKVPGEILSSEVQARRFDEGVHFVPKVVYRFSVGSGMVTAGRLRLAEAGYSRMQAAQRKCDQYPAGSMVTVWYPADQPADAVLETGGGVAGALVLLLGLAMVAGPLWAAEVAGLPGQQMAAGLAALVGLLWFGSRRWRRREAGARRDGLLPPPGCGSDADIERLLGQGEKLLAVRLFRELHGTDLKTAKGAVEGLEKRLRSEKT